MHGHASRFSDYYNIFKYMNHTFVTDRDRLFTESVVRHRDLNSHRNELGYIYFHPDMGNESIA